MTRSALDGDLAPPEQNDPRVKQRGPRHTRGWLVRLADQTIPPEPPWGRLPEPEAEFPWQLVLEYPHGSPEVLRGDSAEEIVAIARDRGMTQLFAWNAASHTYDLTD